MWGVPCTFHFFPHVFHLDPELPTPEAIAIEVVAQADQLYKDHQFEEQVTYLKQYASLDNDEVLWRLARALNDLSKLTDVKSDQKQLIFEAFCHVSRAIEINDRNFACHKVCLLKCSILLLTCHACFFLDNGCCCYSESLS